MAALWAKWTIGLGYIALPLTTGFLDFSRWGCVLFRDHVSFFFASFGYLIVGFWLWSLAVEPSKRQDLMFFGALFAAISSLWFSILC